MHKRWRTVLPTAQLLIVVGTFAWYNLDKSDSGLVYAYPAHDIVIKVNFPIALVWSPILYFMERFPDYFNPTSAVIKTISLVFFVTAFGLSVVLFWYFLMAEVEMRLQNKSMIRFKSWLGEICKTVILFAVGIGAIVYAAFEANRLLHFDRSKTDAVIGGGFLLVWGALFITTSIRDIAYFLRRHSHAAHHNSP
jgi:hypothetical protein